MRNVIKLYVSDRIKTDRLPDIDNFNCRDEIFKIHPFLWNFLFRISSTDKEEKLQRSCFSWDSHYLDTPFNVSSMLPRLFTASCIFNLQNSQCVEPLHLLLTDISDMFSDSSSLFLSINARIGAGISKDSLRRFITSSCHDLEQKKRHITSNMFTIASFDNLDKNCSYSLVGAGKERSGFHGTTIQTVIPKPSRIVVSDKQAEIYNSTDRQTDITDEPSSIEINTLQCSSFSESANRSFSRDRKINPGIVDNFINPVDKVGPPPSFIQNKFSHLSPSDLKETHAEISEWTDFTLNMTKYGFSKSSFQNDNFILPGLKTFFSIPEESTEKSQFTSLAILDESADSKETVLKVVNILHEKFQVGICTDFVLIVGDGKSYDHLIKLKSEYGSNLDWVLPYPDDWHILKNVLQVFIKIYFDAGLKELASKHHRGTTLKVLTECSKFAITH